MSGGRATPQVDARSQAREPETVAAVNWQFCGLFGDRALQCGQAGTLYKTHGQFVSQWDHSARATSGALPPSRDAAESEAFRRVSQSESRTHPPRRRATRPPHLHLRTTRAVSLVRWTDHGRTDLVSGRRRADSEKHSEMMIRSWSRFRFDCSEARGLTMSRSTTSSPSAHLVDLLPVLSDQGRCFQRRSCGEALGCEPRSRRDPSTRPRCTRYASRLEQQCGRGRRPARRWVSSSPTLRASQGRARRNPAASQRVIAEFLAARLGLPGDALFRRCSQPPHRRSSRPRKLSGTSTAATWQPFFLLFFSFMSESLACSRAPSGMDPRPAPGFRRTGDVVVPGCSRYRVIVSWRAAHAPRLHAVNRGHRRSR